MLWRWNCRIVITASQCRKVPVSLSRNRFLKVRGAKQSASTSLSLSTVAQKVSQVLEWIFEDQPISGSIRFNECIFLSAEKSTSVSSSLSESLKPAFHKVSQPQRVRLWYCEVSERFCLEWSPWKPAFRKASLLQQCASLSTVKSTEVFQVPWVRRSLKTSVSQKSICFNKCVFECREISECL